MDVLETRIRVENMDASWSKMTLQNWEMVHNYVNNNLGQIWILYDASKIKLTVIESCLYYIHYRVEWCNSQFLWTYVYGSYDATSGRCYGRIL